MLHLTVPAVAKFSDVTRLVDVLAWPLVVVFAVLFSASPPGRQLLRPLLGRLRKFSAAGVAIELSEETARATKTDVEGGLRQYAGVLSDELDRLSHLYGVRAALEAVVEKGLEGFETKGIDYRATVHVRDPLIADALCQLTNYYPGGDGAFRRFSTRFGILGRAWRLRESLYEPHVPVGPEGLIVEWGMTREQATKAGSGRESFMCLLLHTSRDAVLAPVAKPRLRDVLRGPPAAGREAPASRGNLQVGVLYLDAKPPEAFGPGKDDENAIFRKFKGLTELEDLAAAVAAVDRDVRSLGPAIKVLNSD